jgi:hypothetical protein
MTMLGLLVSRPAALRRSCQRRFIARPPSSTASLLPTVSVPVALDASRSEVAQQQQQQQQQQWLAPLQCQPAQQHRLAAAHSVSARGLGRLEVWHEQ